MSLNSSTAASLVSTEQGLKPGAPSAYVSMIQQLPSDHDEKPRNLLGKRKPFETLARELRKAAASCERRLLNHTPKDRRGGRARNPQNAWTRKHLFCVEECAILTPEHYFLKFRNLPDMQLLARRDGVAMKFFLGCPKCKVAVEYLTMVPQEDAEWACRICNGLVYASQRYSNPNHPLRLLPTPRQWRDRCNGIFPPHYDTRPIVEAILKGEPVESAVGAVMMQDYEKNILGIPVRRKVF